jgi:hypothetical protein
MLQRLTRPKLSFDFSQILMDDGGLFPIVHAAFILSR